MRIPAAIAAIMLTSLACAAPGMRTDTYLLLGDPAGTQTIATLEDGSVRAEFSYSDRDHGDHITATWTLDAAGIPLAYHGRGNNYMKAPVEERFAIEDGKAHWKTLDDEGERASTQAAFYLPADAPPEIYGVLARALLMAPERHLALLPNGEARIERAGAITLGEGRARDEIVHYRINGVGFSPLSIWLDAAGNTLLASAWVSTVPRGRENLVARLIAAQRETDGAWNADLAQRLARAPKGDLLIRNARLFDPRDLTVTAAMSVLVRGERIVRVAPDTRLIAPDAEVIDARDRFLMPGLWDNHQHFADVDGLLDIANGVTSARDLANDIEEFPARVTRFDAGTEIGPRVSKAGMIDGIGKYAGPTKMRVDNAEEAIRAVDWFADHGYVQIKTYMSIKPELIPLIADRAHARGLRHSGHVPAFMSAEQFIEAGADEIQHFNYVVLDLLWPEVQETTRQSERFGKVAERAHEFTPEQPRVRALIDFLKMHHTVLDPTLGILEMRIAGDPRKAAPGLEGIAPRFPPQVRRAMRSAAYAVPAGQEAAYRQAMPAMYRLLKAMHDAGVVIVPGTDTLAGYQLHHELELYVRAGIAPTEVLRMATLTSAQVMGVDNERGVIANGKLADMILVDGDPSREIADIRRVALVLKGGKIFEPAQIEAALGIAPRQ